MSAWIESHQTLRSHPKTRKLARREGVGGILGAVGLLHCLWWWCLDYAQDGDLSRFGAEDIAIACEWDGEPEALVAMLIECGFLDNGQGLTVHDWQEYAGRLLERRERDRQRKAAARRAPVLRTSNGRPADGARTEPNLTEPNLKPPLPPQPVDKSAASVENLGEEQAPPEPQDLIPVVGPIGRLCGVKRIDEALTEGTQLNAAIVRYLTIVDVLADEYLGELSGKALGEAQTRGAVQTRHGVGEYAVEDAAFLRRGERGGQ